MRVEATLRVPKAQSRSLLVSFGPKETPRGTFLMYSAREGRVRSMRVAVPAVASADQPDTGKDSNTVDRRWEGGGLHCSASLLLRNIETPLLEINYLATR